MNGWSDWEQIRRVERLVIIKDRTVLSSIKNLLFEAESFPADHACGTPHSFYFLSLPLGHRSSIELN
jgi:hypothetical protein